MSYDPTDDVQVAALRDEIVANQGYYGDPGSTRDVLAKLNDKEKSRTLAPGKTSYGLTGTQLGNATTLDDAEYAVAVGTRNKEVWVDLLVGFGEQEIPFVHHETLLDAVTGIFNTVDAPTIRAGLLRRQSEFEVLFGPGSQVNKRDYNAARGPGTPGPRMNATQQQAYVDDYMNNYNASVDDIKAGKRSRAAELARITAKAAAKEAPGSTRTWS